MKEKRMNKKTRRISKNEEITKDIKKDIIPKKNNILKHKKAIIITISSVIGALLLFLGYYFIFEPSITLNGKKVIEISYNEKYEDKGAKSKYFGKDITKELKVKGKVNTKKIGKYTITYSIKKNLFKVEKQRIVKVVDKKKPNLELKGDKKVSVCPNKDFEELGYTAIDEYDGEITKNVKVDKKDDKVIYTIKDSSDNETTIERTIIKEDKTKPEINLKGNVTMYLSLGNKYNEPGYTAIDNCDGDITKNVKVDGKVDSSKLGKYTIKYTVTDNEKNTVTKERIVTVYKQNSATMSGGIPGAIYLTFDDGPNSSSTVKILDILKEEGVKATFFITCNGPDSVVKRENDEGHTVALHTASHAWTIYSNVDSYFNDLNKVATRVKRITGKDSKIVRFPGGSSNTVSKRYNKGIMTVLTSEVLNRGYKYYDWNVDGNDAGSCYYKSSEQERSNCVYNNVTKNLSKSRSNIVLMHDIKSYTASALRNIIKYGKNNGYTFEAITTDTHMITQKVNN